MKINMNALDKKAFARLLTVLFNRNVITPDDAKYICAIISAEQYDERILKGGTDK